nr:hypothetical protein [Tanacetum cinerariifolium]
MLQTCLDPSVSLRLILLLDAPDYESCKAFSKLRRDFTALRFLAAPSLGALSQLRLVKADGSFYRSTLAKLHLKQAYPSHAELVPSLAYSSRRTWVGRREFAR